MASSDDGVREINLSGKQLVFLFMAVTVVSVVIFLCGVLVGRGVQQRASTTTVAPAAEELVDAPLEPAAANANPAEPTKTAGLDYPERLESAGPVAEKLVPREAAAATPVASAPAATPGSTKATPTAAPPLPAPATTSTPASARPTSPASPTPAAADAAPGKDAVKDAAPLPPEPKGDGFAIQVTALKGRGEAEAVVSRLKQKGYSAYLMPPLAGQPSVFRVRVGKFKGRADAEKVATRLEREEQFKPWITR